MIPTATASTACLSLILIFVNVKGVPSEKSRTLARNILCPREEMQYGQYAKSPFNHGKASQQAISHTNVDTALNEGIPVRQRCGIGILSSALIVKRKTKLVYTLPLSLAGKSLGAGALTEEHQDETD